MPRAPPVIATIFPFRAMGSRLATMRGYSYSAGPASCGRLASYPSALAMLALAANHGFTAFRSIVLGVLQGVSELFPISSLGHTVILPHLFGWNQIVAY